ncbi:hypothetical protein M7I_0037 [Glarea lozoyensis 74030]|uniref:Uncharacterized protein n=1 Tax=Glarea lozoyensis (strain ATCC 74030 / MF5533) TaxID=1104152 RepID=H0ECA4_GLAL7|nr:hypothetical protein M7I_0037 [Glarea lozoyensis 74030]
MTYNLKYSQPPSIIFRKFFKRLFAFYEKVDDRAKGK